MGNKRDPRDISSYNRCHHNVHCGYIKDIKKSCISSKTIVQLKGKTNVQELTVESDFSETGTPLPPPTSRRSNL